jgi:CubicO group peptidase (beta-lactamase class C family)
MANDGVQGGCQPGDRTLFVARRSPARVARCIIGAMISHRCLVALLLAGAPLIAQTPAGTQHAAAVPDARRIERMLRAGVRFADRPDTAFSLVDRMRYYHVPGISLAVIDDFRIVFAGGYGVKEFGGTQAVDTTTLFLAGSISKPVFATGALALVEQGKLSLDADVNRALVSWHLPESRFTEREKVTLRRLLTHSAGLTVWGFPGYDISKPVPTVPQLLDGTPPANTPAVRNDTTPGARWLYSGGGMTIAQLMTTDVTGEPFPALMRRLVFDRVGMARSTYENPLPEGRRSEAASGHERIDTPVPGRFHVYPEMAAAGLWTTAPELARWAIALAKTYRGDANGPLSPAMARQMISKQMPQQPPYGNGYWGLGVQVGGDGDSLSFSHGGRDEGFVANLVMWPNVGRGLVVMSNGVSGGLLAEIMRGFAEQYGVSAPARTVKRVVTMDRAALSPLAGRYAMPAGRDTLLLEVTVDAGGSALGLYNPAAQRTLRLLPESADTFFDADTGAEWRFERPAGDPAAPPRSLSTGQGPGRRVAMRR